MDFRFPSTYNVRVKNLLEMPRNSKFFEALSAKKQQLDEELSVIGLGKSKKECLFVLVPVQELMGRLTLAMDMEWPSFNLSNYSLEFPFF